LRFQVIDLLAVSLCRGGGVDVVVGEQGLCC